MFIRLRRLLGLGLLVVGLASCGNDDDDANDKPNPPSVDDDDSANDDDDGPTDDDDACALNPSDPSRYVIIGFWLTEDCSGEPVNTNAFPIDDSDGCYCWPGHSGENSAERFSCSPEENSFSYQQYTNLECDASGNGTYKTSYTDRCLPDVPDTLHSMIIEYGACLP